MYIFCICNTSTPQSPVISTVYFDFILKVSLNLIFNHLLTGKVIPVVRPNIMIILCKGYHVCICNKNEMLYITSIMGKFSLMVCIFWTSSCNLNISIGTVLFAGCIVRLIITIISSTTPSDVILPTTMLSSPSPTTM